MLFSQSKPLSWIRMGQHLPKGQIEEGSVKKVRTKKSFDRHLRDKALMPLRVRGKSLPSFS